MIEFDVSEYVVTLGITTYLVGLAVGSVILAPISETYGRRPVYVGAILLFVILIIPCGLAKSASEILIIRFIGGKFRFSLCNHLHADMISPRRICRHRQCTWYYIRYCR
jgi:MFS family permease